MATEASGVAVTTPTDVGLKRELGLIGATWASETSIIGSGWLFGALFAAQAVGGAAVLAWLIAGVVVIVLALCHAELGAMYPVSGGTARFPHFAFGSVAGIGFGFFSYVQAVTIAPIECFAFMQYASYYWPSIYNADTKNVTGVGFILTIILMAIFVAVNFLAMRIFARVNNVITWWKVAVPVLAIIVLLTQWHSGNFTAGGTGFMLGGVAGLAHILRIDAFVSPSGTGLIYTTGTSRVSYGLARNRYFPQIFGRVSSNGIPWVGLIAAFIIGLFFLLPFPSWHSLVGLITGASVLMYAGAPLSVGAFRGQVPDADRPYRMPIAWFLAPAAFVVADLLIYWSGFEVIWKLGVVLVIGYVLIGIFMAMDKQRPPLDWKSAVWLPVWLIGMGIISWQRQYSGGAVAAPVNIGHIGF